MDIVLVTGNDMPKPDDEVPLLVDALSARGLRVTVQAWGSAGADGVAWDSVALIVIKSMWVYFDDRDAFLAWAYAAGGASIMANPPDVLDWNSHKRYLLDLQGAGVPILDTDLVECGADESRQAAALARFAGDIVVKPAVRGGAMDAMRTTASDGAAAEHLRTLTASGDALVQRFEPSVLEAGEASLIYFGGRFSHAIRKVPAAGDYRVQAYYGGQVLAHEPTALELETAAAALRVAPTNELAYARVDLIRLGAEPEVMELELIEPELFLPYADGAAERYDEALHELLPKV